jgi:endonuclease YncB( thermonuclease family)
MPHPLVDKNINLEMLSAGWAVTYRTDDRDYLGAEQVAQEKKIGVWQGKFMRPEYYRRLQRDKNRENWRK